MNKFDYYLHLRDLGIKEKHAVKMVKQAHKNCRQISTCASGAIFGFAAWQEPEEGYGYWDVLYDKVIEKEERARFNAD